MGGGVGYRDALNDAGTAGTPTGQPGGLAVGQKVYGGVAYGGAWGGDGAVGASYGQMGMFTSAPEPGFSHGDTLGAAGATGQVGGPDLNPGGRVGYGGVMSGAGFSNSANE